MTEQTQKQKGTTLWGIADQLRGAMNADNYEAAVVKELMQQLFPFADEGWAWTH